MTLTRVFEEIFPFVTAAISSRKLRRLAASTDLIQQRPIYDNYTALTLDQLSTRLQEERLRATALDEKTFKMTLSLSIGLTVVSATSAILASSIGTIALARAVQVMLAAGTMYVFIGGYVALAGIRTEISFGYGTEPLLLNPTQRRAAFADALPRQELMNQIRHVRNEAAYQSLRNGFVLMFAALLLFIVAKVIDIYFSSSAVIPVVKP